MPRRLEDIESRVAEVQRLEEAAQNRERRILEVSASIYSEQEKGDVAGLGKLLEKAGVKSGDIEEFFKIQGRAASRMIERATPELQLTEEELTFIATQERAIRLIDPCLWIHSSPGWECVWNATSCNSSQHVSADASASCTCNIPNNELNPQAKAEGQGAMGRRWARLDSWCDFDIPARPTHATVNVSALVAVHGFYVLNRGTQWATFSLDLEMTGYQYGVAWASDSIRVLDVHGTDMGRYDANRSLQFVMPVGADPFQVRVWAKLRATAKGGGAVSLGDFATGNGNYIRIFWINTYSP
jgi:hypothetical protein